MMHGIPLIMMAHYKDSRDKRQIINKKKPGERHALSGLRGHKNLSMSYSCTTWAALPSALYRFTSEFGMGSGGTSMLWSRGNWFVHSKYFLSPRCSYVV